MARTLPYGSHSLFRSPMVEITNVDPQQAAEVDLNVTGITAKSASGETLTAPKVDSVNTFEAPNSVLPKPISARAQGGKLIL